MSVVLSPSAAAGLSPALHGAVLAVLALSNNLIGLAPGPVVTGFLAERLSLSTAIQITPVAALMAAAVFWIIGSTQPSTQKTRPKVALGGSNDL